MATFMEKLKKAMGFLTSCFPEKGKEYSNKTEKSKNVHLVKGPNMKYN